MLIEDALRCPAERLVKGGIGRGYRWAKADAKKRNPCAATEKRVSVTYGSLPVVPGDGQPHKPQGATAAKVIVRPQGRFRARRGSNDIRKAGAD